VAFVAMSFLPVDTAPKVLFACDWLQVLRITATPDATDMVNIHLSQEEPAK
jgi:hypothetical protein